MGLEHEVEFAGFRQSANFFGIWTINILELVYLVKADRISIPGDLIPIFGPQTEDFWGPCSQGFILFFGIGKAGHEHLLVAVLRPTAPDLIVTVTFFGFSAVNHHVMEEVVVTGALPDLRMHDDGAVESSHFETALCAGKNTQIVMVGDHVLPPGFLDVPLQLNAKRAVIPATVHAAVDLTGLEDESPPFAQRDDFLHDAGFFGAHGASLGKD